MVLPPAIEDPQQTVTLSVTATAWPPPVYQWYHNGRKISTEGDLPELKILMTSEPAQDARVKFRCLHCKQVRSGL